MDQVRMETRDGTGGGGWVGGGGVHTELRHHLNLQAETERLLSADVCSAPAPPPERDGHPSGEGWSLGG